MTEDNSEWKYVISCIGIRPTGEEITKTESIPIKANNDELEYGLKKTDFRIQRNIFGTALLLQRSKLSSWAINERGSLQI